jgi:hypothetical protein
MPILKDLLRNNDSDPIKEDQIIDACEDKIPPKDVKDGLKKLVD